jgi:hypothetical protein
MKHNTLAIFGDSWACGAFSNEADGWTGIGDFYFQQQLSRKYEIVNFASGGLSNVRTLISLNDYLQANNRSKILVVQTDPIRDCYPNHDYGLMDSRFCDIFQGDIKQFAETQIELFYYQLDRLVVKHGVEINIIGGCSDLHPSIAKYKNLNALCYSWFKLIDDNHRLGIFSNTTNIGQVINVNSYSDRDIVNQIYEKQMIIDREQGKLFGYGGDNHPSHAGQDLMITYLEEKL